MGKDEVCPKCHSLTIGVLCFNEEDVNYECRKCRYRWVLPRRLLDGMMKSHFDVACERCSQLITPPLRCCSRGGKYHSEALFFVCPRCGQVYHDEGDFIVRKFFKRRMTQKIEVTSLEELCQKFDQFKDDKMLVRPYLPKTVGKGEHDFGLIVECEHAIYEIGLSRNEFRDRSPGHFWKSSTPQRTPLFDFDWIRRKMGEFEAFARGLSLYLAEKGYPAIPLEIQHLDRNPKRLIVEDKQDRKIFFQIMAKI